MAVRLLQALPARLSGLLLIRAIRGHAWTFFGAGSFKPSGAWKFEIDRRDADDPVLLPESLFHWYGKVFERLYRRLVSSGCECKRDRPASALSYRHTFRIARR